MFDWSEGYLLGNPDIDSEHRALFRLAQDLYKAVAEKRDRSELESLLARLVAYTRFHFAGEEALMRREGYPNMAQHQAEHRTLGDRVDSLAAELAAGEPNAAAAIIEFLTARLMVHVRNADQAVGDFLRSKSG